MAKKSKGKSAGERSAWLIRRKKRKIKKYENLIKKFPRDNDFSTWEKKLKFWKE